mmetsp:Transcript_59284/g.109559  ORF Transcript_59284/g.109559 Transcript_59284/m.109559 type:complete len:386 (+) Transcript_59284:93-1250(+)
MTRTGVCLSLLAITLLGSAVDAATLKTEEVAVDANGRSRKRARTMLTQLQAMSDKKEKMGLVPSEMAEAEEVRAALINNILPAILEQADDKQQDLDELFQDILDCQMEVSKGLHVTVQLETSVHKWEETVTDCVDEEVVVVGDKVEVCEKFTEMKSELRYPTDFPTLTALPEEVEEYLRTMHEYFCGFWHTYEHAWEDCRMEQHNTTNTTEVCTDSQHEFEKAICEATITRKRTCTLYDSCYAAAVQKYEAKVNEIKEHLADLEEEYEASTKILCLWDAWQLSCSPCTVDNTKVELCWEEHVNISMVNITFDDVPPPIECPTEMPELEAADTPCTDEFIQKHYAPHAAQDDVLQRMQTSCMACFGLDDVVSVGAKNTSHHELTVR